MVEKNLNGLLFLDEDISRDKIKTSIERLTSRFPSLEMSLSLDDMVESFFDFPHRREIRGEKDAGYLGFGDVEFCFQNLEPSRRFRYIFSGRRQVFVNVWMEPDVGAYAQFLKEPEKAMAFLELLSNVASSLDGYLGFVGHELMFKSIDDTTDLEYARRLLRRFSTFYLDRELAESIGLKELREWAEIYREVDNSGVFVSYQEDPFLSGGLVEPEKAIQKDEATFYHERVLAEIMDRIRSEFASLM